ncbi:uncharacterized protein LOC126885718 isoform X3 [Diabrotica virgifera virgifera]|nr:uncharacterized protein LOC126885718 isoform X3 [Diabrotica virgifera virgifera]
MSQLFLLSVVLVFSGVKCLSLVIFSGITPSSMSQLFLLSVVLVFSGVKCLSLVIFSGIIPSSMSQLFLLSVISVFCGVEWVRLVRSSGISRLSDSVTDCCCESGVESIFVVKLLTWEEYSKKPSFCTSNCIKFSSLTADQSTLMSDRLSTKFASSVELPKSKLLSFVFSLVVTLLLTVFQKRYKFVSFTSPIQSPLHFLNSRIFSLPAHSSKYLTIWCEFSVVEVPGEDCIGKLIDGVLTLVVLLELEDFMSLL